jgi:histidinol dehydrogenase
MLTANSGALRILDLRQQTLNNQQLNEILPRAKTDVTAAVAQIRPLLEDVKARGESAIVEVAEKFDGVDPRPLRVSTSELEAALLSLDPQLRKSIEISIDRVRAVSEANIPETIEVEFNAGAKVIQRWRAVDSVGLYVPGGKAVYPSSVIMNVVPAQAAGVSRLVISTPAQKDFGGRPHPTVLATAALLGVEEVLCIGGPAAIAAFAFGIKQIDFEPVNLVTGPGNIYVAAAKRALRGEIGIDSEAGTTEIMIIADSTANAEFIAYDLVSQAEHDEAAASVLVTDSIELANEVQSALEQVMADTAHRERVASALSGQQSAIVLVDSIASAVRVANDYATEHLEIHTENPAAVAAAISNAGAIFLGQYSPVSLGDYMAGSNHVLPTGQQAKFGAGLGVHTFLRAQQLIDYSAAALADIAADIDRFAQSEGLPAHGDAVKIRNQRG